MMNVTMAEICKAIHSRSAEDAAKVLLESLTNKDPHERRKATELFAAIKSISQIWDGFPVGISEHEDGGSVFTPIGSDAPDRSSYIRIEDGEDDGRKITASYVACGDRMGMRIYFITFSTTYENAMELARKWITSGYTPMDR